MPSLLNSQKVRCNAVVETETDKLPVVDSAQLDLALYHVVDESVHGTEGNIHSDPESCVDASVRVDTEWGIRLKLK